MSKFVRNPLSGKSLPEKNGVSEMLTNGKELYISNSITGKKIYSQISLLEKKASLKYHYRKKIVISNIDARNIF